MKAVVFHEHGGLDKLRYEETPLPVVGSNVVLVKVGACALNHLDIWAREGVRRVKVTLPHISGSDISGTIAEVGDSVSQVNIKDRVVVSPGLSCGKCEFCVSGQDNFCLSYHIIGSYKVDGGYAEYVTVPEENVLPMPKSLTFEEAAAIPLVFLTAWHMLVTRAGIRSGERVLVLGAGSGVGSAAIQVAKLHGAWVIATGGSDEKLEKARSLGADQTINHSTHDILESVKSLTGKKGVDIVIEHVGSATWDKSVKSLAPGGRMVTCGSTSGPDGVTDIRYIYAKQLSILGSYMGTREELIEVLRFVNQDMLKPVVDRVMPLEDASRAQQMMVERKHFGKIILKP